jgi:hypothetical protein
LVICTLAPDAFWILIRHLQWLALWFTAASSTMILGEEHVKPKDQIAWANSQI